MNTVLLVEKVVTTVVGFCAETFLIIYVVLLREEFMALAVEKKWLWGSLKRKVVGSM